MGVKIIVDTQNLLTASDAMIEKADEYKRISDSLLDEINYMGMSWGGLDNLAFVNQVNGFKDDFDQLHKILMQYADILQIVDREYQKTLNDSYAIVNSI